MTINQLRNAVKAEPFRPFTVSLTDGRSVRVRQPECIFIPLEASRTFIVAESGEDYSIIDLPFVTSLDFGDGKKKNGSRPRKK